MTRRYPQMALWQVFALLALVSGGAFGCSTCDGAGSVDDSVDGGTHDDSIEYTHEYRIEVEEALQEGGGDTDPVFEEPAEQDPVEGGGEGEGEGGGETGGETGGVLVPVVSPVPLFCDDPLHDGEQWLEVEMGDLALRFLPGTPAERDLDRIAAARQQAYDRIVDFLGLVERPKITVVLSPTRTAARHHGYGVGRAIKSLSRVDVLWPEGEGSYERERPGHEISHILAVHVDGKLGRLAFLDEGLAELLDGSERDLHRDYVDKLLAGQEQGFPTRMNDWDAWGMNYGRAGSFVAFLVDRYGKDRFLDLWRAAATTGGWAQITTLGDSVEDGPSLETALDRLLRRTHGMGFEAARLAWEATLQPYFESPPTMVSEQDLIEMLSLVAAADRAIARGDAVGFRATLEGFYCDSWTDDAKAELAREVVAAYERVDTTVISAFPVGLRNYQEVVLHTVRREVRRGDEATLRTGMLWLERFPEGWRISWSNAW